MSEKKIIHLIQTNLHAVIGKYCMLTLASSHTLGFLPFHTYHIYIIVLINTEIINVSHVLFDICKWNAIHDFLINLPIITTSLRTHNLHTNPTCSCIRKLWVLF